MVSQPDRIGFAIVGAQKAATSFLHEALRRHPQVAMPAGETSLFQMRHHTPPKVERLVAGLARPGAICGIKRPSYLYDATAAELLHAHNPAMRIIIVLRDPIDRARSGYFHLQTGAHLPLVGLDEGMAAILDGAWSMTCPTASTVLHYGLYARGVARYRRLFGENRVLVATQAEAGRDPLGLLSRVCAFLDLDPPQPALLPDHRPQAVLYESGCVRLAHHIAQLRAHVNEAGIALQQRRTLSPWRRWRIAQLTRQLNVRRSAVAQTPHALAPAIRARLEAFYAADREALRREHGIELAR